MVFIDFHCTETDRRTTGGAGAEGPTGVPQGGAGGEEKDRERERDATPGWLACARSRSWWEADGGLIRKQQAQVLFPSTVRIVDFFEARSGRQAELFCSGGAVLIASELWMSSTFRTYVDQSADSLFNSYATRIQFLSIGYSILI